MPWTPSRPSRAQAVSPPVATRARRGGAADASSRPGGRPGAGPRARSGGRRPPAPAARRRRGQRGGQGRGGGPPAGVPRPGQQGGRRHRQPLSRAAVAPRPACSRDASARLPTTSRTPPSRGGSAAPAAARDRPAAARAAASPADPTHNTRPPGSGTRPPPYPGPPRWPQSQTTAARPSAAPGPIRARTAGTPARTVPGRCCTAAQPGFAQDRRQVSVGIGVVPGPEGRRLQRWSSTITRPPRVTRPVAGKAGATTASGAEPAAASAAIVRPVPPPAGRAGWSRSSCKAASPAANGRPGQPLPFRRRPGVQAPAVHVDGQHRWFSGLALAPGHHRSSPPLAKAMAQSAAPVRSSARISQRVMAPHLPGRAARGWRRNAGRSRR